MPRTLLEFLPAYRNRHPVGEEHVALTLVGSPKGAPRRQMLRLVLFVVVAGTIGGVIGAQGSNFVVWVFASVVTAMLLSAVARPGRDQPVGISVSDKRVVVAQHRRRQEPKLLQELPAEAVRQADLEVNVEPFFFPERFARVSFSGDGGPIVTLDMPNTDPATLWVLLSEAGLDRTGGPPEPPVQDEPVRFWLLKAFSVGTCFFFGVAAALLGVVALVSEGDGSGAVVIGFGVVLALVGEALRRRLLPRRPSSS